MEGLPLAGSQELQRESTDTHLSPRSWPPATAARQAVSSFKALSVGALPKSWAFKIEQQRILKVTFHLPRAQSHEVDLLSFVVYRDQLCPVGVLVCVLSRADCGYWTLSEAGKHSFAGWDSARSGLCILPSNNTLDNLGPLPAYPVYTHASEQCTWQCQQPKSSTGITCLHKQWTKFLLPSMDIKHKQVLFKCIFNASCKWVRGPVSPELVCVNEHRTNCVLCMNC